MLFYIVVCLVNPGYLLRVRKMERAGLPSAAVCREVYMKTIRAETEDGVRSIIFNRPKQYNTITFEFREELAAAIDYPKNGNYRLFSSRLTPSFKTI